MTTRQKYAANACNCDIPCHRPTGEVNFAEALVFAGAVEAGGCNSATSPKPIPKRTAVHGRVRGRLRLPVFNHERLTCRFQRRNFRLTDVHGKVVTALIA